MSFFGTRRQKYWGIILMILIVGIISLSAFLSVYISLKNLSATPATHRATGTSRTPGTGLSPRPSTFAQISYHTSGKQILDNMGRPYIPYGVFVGGILLADQNWRQNGVKTYVSQDAVQAAHDFWFSNLVSLQVAYEPLFPQGSDGPIDSQYLAFIDQVVKQANALGMNVSIVLQEEAIYSSEDQRVNLPSHDAMVFWDMMSRHYARNQHVFFDLFNEPDISGLTEPAGDNANDCLAGSGTQMMTWDDACAWSYWKNGTTQAGVRYYGMDQIAQKIRHNGAQNLIFVQGLATGEDLALLANTFTAQYGREFLLTTPNVVYAVHPYFGPSHDTQSQWDQWFGSAIENGNFPVLASEWSLNQEKGSGCEANSKLQIHQIGIFLRYLRIKHIGLVGWALQAGELIRDWNFRNPTTFQSSVMPTDCDVPPFSTNPQAQGAGQLLRTYFATYSIQATYS